MNVNPLQQKYLSTYLAQSPQLDAAQKTAVPNDRVTLSGSKTPTVTGYDPAYLDTSVRPQDDFSQYSVGGYIKSHPIPDDKASWGVFAELADRVRNSLKTIVDALPANAPAGSNDQKLYDFYQSGMNTAKIDAAGITPLQPEFDRIAKIQNLGDLQDQVAHMHANGFGALFGFGPAQDVKNPGAVIGEADQGGLSLPNRDYYLSTDPQKTKVKDAWVDHMTNMFKLAGDSPLQARVNALEVLAVETRLAEGCLTPEQMRDPNATYNMTGKEQLAKLTPNFDWSRYFSAVGRPDIDKINVGMPAFFSKLDNTLATTPLSQWKTYLRWQVIDQMAPYLSTPIEQEDFNFKGKILSGQQKESPRWQHVVRATDNMLGDALGEKYVAANFTPAAKAKALDMVNNIKSAVRDMINNGWMSDESKKGALAKVDKLGLKIGYPDQWKDYSALDIHDDVYANNIMRAQAFQSQSSLATIGKPMDRNAWQMTPATVNAYYDPTHNEMVFPAAILQPPMFDLNADDALNYGAAGAIIGHELSHGFDDQGSQFDADGGLNPWMTPADQKEYTRRAEGVAKQFDEFTFDGQKCNGHLVEGESIADLGGMELAWAAFQKASAGRPAAQTTDTFTPQQRFFLSHSLAFAESMRPELAHVEMSNDPHPLPMFRINGPVANMDEFYQAFDVHPGDPMMRPENERNKIWKP